MVVVVVRDQRGGVRGKCPVPRFSARTQAGGDHRLDVFVVVSLGARKGRRGEHTDSVAPR